MADGNDEELHVMLAASKTKSFIHERHEKREPIKNGSAVIIVSAFLRALSILRGEAFA